MGQEAAPEYTPIERLRMHAVPMRWDAMRGILWLTIKRVRMPSIQEILLVRHGETEWSVSGQHTGRTDIPLTENGRVAARRLAPLLAGRSFALVLTSPLQRAQETCQLAGLGTRAETDADLLEWDYGAYEGLTPQQIRAERPTWMIFADGCPGGETPLQIGERVDRAIARARAAAGNVALFAHGHILRVFAARWLGLTPSAGSHFMLSTATVSVLSTYHGIAAIKHWNAPLIAKGPPVTGSAE